VLFQEPSHLYLTIRQNVTMRFEKTPTEDARIHEALEIAGLRRVVEGLPEGIDTLVGAGFGGRLDLSGGQWQRLALARLIYQDAPVMILDEPVASLDPEGERAVFELFARLTQAKVILFTTHRYDSIPRDTKIVVLVDGRIAETGTHEELLQRQREYWSLYVSGAPAPGNAPRRETGRATPQETSSTSATRPRRFHPTRPAGQQMPSLRARRVGRRLLYTGKPDAAPASHNGTGDGLSPNDRRWEYPRPTGVRRLVGVHDGEVDLRGGVGEPMVRPPAADAGAVPALPGQIGTPRLLDLRWVQDAVWDSDGQSPGGEHGSVGLVAAHRARAQTEPLARGGDHVR
jgi:ABC-type thiamine transport system ATPase subunit